MANQKNIITAVKREVSPEAQRGPTFLIIRDIVPTKKDIKILNPY